MLFYLCQVGECTLLVDITNSGDMNAVIEKIYIYGSYAAGCSFHIKIVFESHNSIWTQETG